jgi:hypothetical protein
MMVFGSTQVVEGFSWVFSGDEQNRGFNPVRAGAQQLSVIFGGDAKTGEAAYHGLAFISNIGSALVPVTHIASYSNGYLWITQPRMDTFSAFKDAALTGSAISNVYKATQARGDGK